MLRLRLTVINIRPSRRECVKLDLYELNFYVFLSVGAGCSHGFSHEYFTESIRSTGFIGRKCSSYTEYQLGRCQFSLQYPTAIMGENIDTKSQGTFYLNVNAQPPFAKNGAIF